MNYVLKALRFTAVTADDRKINIYYKKYFFMFFIKLKLCVAIRIISCKMQLKLFIATQDIQGNFLSILPVSLLRLSHDTHDTQVLWVNKSPIGKQSVAMYTATALHLTRYGLNEFSKYFKFLFPPNLIC